MFMTCSTSYCLVTLKDLWNAYMYVVQIWTMMTVAAIKITATLWLYLTKSLLLAHMVISVVITDKTALLNSVRCTSGALKILLQR